MQRVHKLRLVLDQYSETQTNDENEEVKGEIVVEICMTAR